MQRWLDGTSTNGSLSPSERLAAVIRAHARAHTHTPTVYVCTY